jgi:hypothetical protein
MRKPTSYADLARSLAMSKSTIAAIIAGRYHARTTTGHVKVIDQILCNRLAEFKPADSAILKFHFERYPGNRRAKTSAEPPLADTQRPTVRVPRAIYSRTVRVSPEGFIRLGRLFYYAGSEFAGLTVTVRREPGSTLLEISSAGAARFAAPIDPATNQLGYHPHRRGANHEA